MCQLFFLQKYQVGTLSKRAYQGFIYLRVFHNAVSGCFPPWRMGEYWKAPGKGRTPQRGAYPSHLCSSGSPEPERVKIWRSPPTGGMSARLLYRSAGALACHTRRRAGFPRDRTRAREPGEGQGMSLSLALREGSQTLAYNGGSRAPIWQRCNKSLPIH